MKHNLHKIAELMSSLMANAGIQDDYDEVIGDHYDNDPEGAEKYHQSVLEAIAFIDEYTDGEIDEYFNAETVTRQFNEVKES